MELEARRRIIMIKFGKRAIALILAVLMLAGVMAGCKRQEAAKLDENAVLMTIGDAEFKAGLCNFYLRYQQSLMESLYGANAGYNIWEQATGDNKTYEDVMKNIMLEQFQETLIIYLHAEDYKVELTENELKNIESLAEAFEKANSKEAQEKASATKAYAAEYMKIHTIAKKVTDLMKQDIDKNVSDEDAKQKIMRYVLFETKSSMSKDELAKKKKEAEDFLAAAQAKGSLEDYGKEKEVTTTKYPFNAKSTSLDEKVIKAADALAEKAFTIVETDKGFYVIQLESLFDSEATAEKKASILKERGEARYKELLEKWQKDMKVVVNQNVLDTISFNDLKINSIQKEENKEDDNKDDNTDDNKDDNTDDNKDDNTENKTE